MANRLNTRFRYGQPSGAHNGQPLSAGVVIHQFDEFEARNKPWAPCDHTHQYQCHENSFGGRMSTSLIFRAMKERLDRVRIPMISWGGGVVVNPTISIKCAYGDDGSTWRAPGGCYHDWCNPQHPCRNNDCHHNHPCGFGAKDRINQAWRPSDLGTMLQLYNQHSQHYRSPQFYSGYNELVYAGSEWNGHLPHTVEAFFGCFSHNGYNHNGPTASKHRAFLREYHVSADDVPLLDFDPSDWVHPFKVPEGPMVYADVFD